MSDKVTEALRPSSKELDAQRIEIECVEPPKGGGEGDGYIVTVWPKPKKKDKEKEGNKSSPCCGSDWEPPVKRVFETEEATLDYIKKVL
jgi:hypothetical protein